MGEYNGERWACSGLDVVTEIYDCGEIGKKKKNRGEKKWRKKYYVEIVLLPPPQCIHTHGRHDYYVNYLIHTNPHTVDNL